MPDLLLMQSWRNLNLWENRMMPFSVLQYDYRVQYYSYNELLLQVLLPLLIGKYSYII